MSKTQCFGRASSQPITSWTIGWDLGSRRDNFWTIGQVRFDNIFEKPWRARRDNSATIRLCSPQYFMVQSRNGVTPITTQVSIFMIRLSNSKSCAVFYFLSYSETDIIWRCLGDAANLWLLSWALSIHLRRARFLAAAQASTRISWVMKGQHYDNGQSNNKTNSDTLRAR